MNLTPFVSYCSLAMKSFLALAVFKSIYVDPPHMWEGSINLGGVEVVFTT